MIRYLTTARDRLRRRLTTARGEDGFTLIYTLLVITLVTVLVGSALVVAAANVVPATRTAHALAAEAAARSGIDAFLAELEKDCPNGSSSTVAACTPDRTSDSYTLVSDNGYTSAYSYSVQKSPTNSWFRVTSTGTVTAGAENVSKTLVADISGGSSTNDYDYNVVVGYETQAPDVVMSQFPTRTISLGASARSAAGLPSSAGSVTWAGAQSGSAAGSVNVCNALYAGLNGRSHNAPPGATTPYVDWVETGTAGSGSYSDYQPCQVSLGHSTDLEQASAAQGTGGYASHDALLLSNSFPGGSGPLLNQPVQTGYEYDPTTATACDSPNQDYRSFNLLCAGYAVEVGGSPAPGSTYTPTYVNTLPSVPSTITLPASGSCTYTGPTRVYLNGDGTATITSPQTTTPVSGSPSACYPSSMSGGIFQYRTPVLSGISGFNGIFSVTNDGSAPASTPTSHSSTGWNLTGQKATSTPSASDTVFYQRVDAASSPDPNSATPSGFTQAGANAQTWSAYSSTKKCGAVSRQTDTPNGPKPWDEQTFQCDWFGRMGDNTYLPPLAPSDGYTAFQTQLNTDLATTTAQTIPGNNGNTLTATVNGTTTTNKNVNCTSQSFVPANATADQLVCLIQHDLRPANTGTNEANWANPSKTGYTHQYVVSAYNQSTSTTSSPVGAVPTTGVSDPLFDGRSTGTASTETVTTTTTTFNVSSQVYGCYQYGLVGTLLGSPTGTMDVTGSSCTNLIPTGKYAWGNGYYPNTTSPQFQFTIVTKTYSNFAQGTSATAYFPSMQDVTQYATGAGGANGTTGPGDLYVEGTATSTVSFVAQDDVVITGSLQPASSNAAVQVVANDDVRIYHPVKCASTDTTAIGNTTAGFCPNDITGLYTGVPAASYRPDQQYVNLRDSGSTALTNLTVNAAIFAVGGSTPSALCPQWSASGTCGGEFSVDNYNRGSSLGTLTVQGTLVMQHHGPVGREWEIADSSGQSSRPQSGYQLDLRYQNLGGTLSANSSIAGVLTTQTTTSASWHVVSTSTGAP